MSTSDASAPKREPVDVKTLPNIQALMQGCVSGQYAEWPGLRAEVKACLDEITDLRAALELARKNFWQVQVRLSDNQRESAMGLIGLAITSLDAALRGEPKEKAQ